MKDEDNYDPRKEKTSHIIQHMLCVSHSNMPVKSGCSGLAGAIYGRVHATSSKYMEKVSSNRKRKRKVDVFYHSTIAHDHC